MPVGEDGGQQPAATQDVAARAGQEGGGAQEVEGHPSTLGEPQQSCCGSPQAQLELVLAGLAAGLESDFDSDFAAGFDSVLVSDFDSEVSAERLSVR